MVVRQRQIEKPVHILVARPLSWAVYGCGVIIVLVALAGVRGLAHLIRKRGAGSQTKEELCPRQS